MPDITMCTNQDCPLSYSCWRFNCPPSQYQQSYAKFEPTIDEVVECEMYLEVPNTVLPADVPPQSEVDYSKIRQTCLCGISINLCDKVIMPDYGKRCPCVVAHYNSC